MLINRNIKVDSLRSIKNIRSIENIRILKKPLLNKDIQDIEGANIGNLYNLIKSNINMPTENVTNLSINDILIKPRIDRKKYTSESSFNNIFDAEKVYIGVFKTLFESGSFSKTKSSNIIEEINTTLFGNPNYIISLISSSYSTVLLDKNYLEIFTACINNLIPSIVDGKLYAVINNSIIDRVVSELSEMTVDYLNTLIDNINTEISKYESLISLNPAGDNSAMILEVEKLQKQANVFKTSLETLDYACIPLDVIIEYTKLIRSNLTTLENLNILIILKYLLNVYLESLGLRHVDMPVVNNLIISIATIFGNVNASKECLVENYNTLIKGIQDSEINNETNRFIF